VWLPRSAFVALLLTVTPPALNIPLGHGFKATIQPGFLHDDFKHLHVKRGASEFVLRWSHSF
jgi:hypothetical protein